jgi:hypothetical protein
MFRTLLRPSSGVLKTVVATATGSGNRPRTSLLDIYHPDPWHAPVAVTAVFITPDDGPRKRPKHVE